MTRLLAGPALRHPMVTARVEPLQDSIESLDATCEVRQNS